VNLRQYWLKSIDRRDIAAAFVKDTPIYLISIAVLFLYPVVFKGQFGYLLLVIFYSTIALTVFRRPYESTHINLTITTIMLTATLSVLASMFGDFVANMAALWITLRFREALVLLINLGVMEVNESKSRFRNK